MRRLSDPAWKHCTPVDENGKPNRVICNYCGHSMWGGVSRCKEHLAQKRGDVIPCRSCPPEVTAEMKDLLIQQARKREEVQKRKREALEQMRHVGVVAVEEAEGSRPRSRLRTTATTTAMDNKEKEEEACLEQAMKESMLTYEMEKKNAEMDAAVFEIACRESLRYYELEQRFRGEGCSSTGSKTGPSRPNYDIDLDIEAQFDSDYDSDLGF